MLVRNRMSRQVVAVSPQHTVQQAKELMTRHALHHLPVVRGRRLVGIVSDRDLHRKGETIARVMTRNPVAISPEASVDEAASVMQKNRFNALPVVERGQLVGMLSSADVLRAFVALSGVAEPTARIVAAAKGHKNAKQRICEIVHQNHGELKWLHRQGYQFHLRLKARNVGEIVNKLEAAGFDVTTVLEGRKLQRRRTRRA